MFGKASKPQNRIDSLIGASTRIEGNVVFSGGLRVDGAIRGNVSAPPDQSGTLVLSQNARIDGEVQVAHLVINGTVIGSIRASESLELQPNARVKGDVYYKTLEMQQGAIVEGKLVHQEGVGELKAVELKLASGA